jgi:hypothetical protein
MQRPQLKLWSLCQDHYAVFSFFNLLGFMKEYVSLRSCTDSPWHILAGSLFYNAFSVTRLYNVDDMVISE